MAVSTKVNFNDKRIKPGDLLLTEKPFVYTLKYQYRTERCDLCFKRSNSLFMCSACRYVFYCDKKCQKIGWKVHKSECQNLRRMLPGVLPNYGRMLLRLLRLLHSGDGHQKKSYYGVNEFRMYKDLMSHYSNLKDDKRRIEDFEDIHSILKTICVGECLPNAVVLMDMYGRICINGFSILEENVTSIGFGIYLGASVMDHSCTPNACTTFDGTTIYVRALKEMDYLDWSRVSISYIDVLNTTHDRQQELLSGFYFLCKCDRCLAPDFAEVSAAACPNSGCDQPIDVRQQLKQCPKCGTIIDAEFIKKFLEVDQLTDMHLKQIDELTLDYDVCVLCLNRQKEVMHKFNIKHVKMLDFASRSSFELQKWNDALIYTMELRTAYRKYLVEDIPTMGLLDAMMDRFPLFKKRLEEKLNHAKNAH